MSNQHQFCCARAEQARRDAADASLANVRDRFLNAAAAWDLMAARARRTERGRTEIEARKAAQAAAAAAE